LRLGSRRANPGGGVPLSNSAIMLARSPAAVLTFGFTGIDEDEALGLAKKFDSKEAGKRAPGWGVTQKGPTTQRSEFLFRA
jgi:hypothetical protein